jgi:pSer/pThr/pTyr-binding forkhead associated (FHA) protein
VIEAVVDDGVAGAGHGATRVAAAALLRQAALGGVERALPHLRVRAAGRPERLVPLGEELTIGRGGEAGLRIADAAASRLHARLRVEPDGAASVEDLGSKNGVRLDGERIGAGPRALRPGAALLIGETELTYVDPLASNSGGEGRAPGEEAGVARPASDVAGPGVGASRSRLLAGAALLLGAAAALLAAS